MKIHIKLIDEKGNEYEGDLIKTAGKNRTTFKSQTKKISKPTPTILIKKSYIEKFFQKEQKLGDVIKKLKSEGYNFNSDSIYRALQRSKFLKRQGSVGTYKFVQKYPPS